MKKTEKALLWATLIIGAAIYTNEIGMSDAASFGVTLGLVGAAWGSLQNRRIRCTKECA